MTRTFINLALIFSLFINKLQAQVFTYSATPVNMSGPVGSTFNYNITFTNPSASSITIEFDRYQKFEPPYWYSCFCYITCNPPSLDYVDIELPPNSSTVLTVLFKTDSVNPGTATASIRINQSGFGSSADTVHLNASTFIETGIQNHANNVLSVSYPNPFKNEFLFRTGENNPYSLQVRDLAGKIILEHKNIITGEYILQLENLPPGEYLLSAVYASGKREDKKIIKN